MERKSKFNVGDRVRYNGKRGTGFDKSLMGREGAVVKDDGDACVMVDWEESSYGRYGVYRENIELISLPSSPAIRTVVRREIVPGAYLDGGVEIFDDGSVIVRDWTAAPLLREAAHLFNQLAEVLEENAAADKKEAA